MIQSEQCAERALILTCMDARIDPTKFDDINGKCAYNLRNAGGRVTEDSVRSMAVATRLFAVDKYYIVHHFDCGMQKVDNLILRSHLSRSLGPCKLGLPCPSDLNNSDHTNHSDNIDFLPIDDIKQSLQEDIQILQAHPLISTKVHIYGYAYDIKNNKLIKIF